MNAYAKARKLSVLMEARDRLSQLVDPDLKLLEEVDAEIRKLHTTGREEVDEETGEIR